MSPLVRIFKRRLTGPANFIPAYIFKCGNGSLHNDCTQGWTINQEDRIRVSRPSARINPGELNQVPQIAIQVFKNRHRTVRLGFGLPNEHNAR